MLCIAWLALLAQLVGSSPIHEEVKDLTGRLDEANGFVFVAWSGVEQNIPYLVRYKLSSIPTWTYQRSRGKTSKVELPGRVAPGDRLEIQVRADDRTNERWSDSIIVPLQPRSAEFVDQSHSAASNAQANLSPPLDFTANIKDGHAVELQWMPSTTDPEVYYLVNIRQVTSKKRGPLHRQQIKTAATSFELRGLEAGASYELAVRSALPEKISHTAAVVLVKMPQEDEFFEIGNLIIASRFMSDGRGTVNLTWHPPSAAPQQITEFEVRYSEKDRGNWRKAEFAGTKPKVTLYDLSSDTEYQLEISARLADGSKTEPTRYSFSTPKVGSQRVSAGLANEESSEIDTSAVTGYDVYLSEDQNAPQQTWQRLQANDEEGTVTIPGLQSLTTYYVRIDVRMQDGKTVRVPTVYKFTTIGAHLDDETNANMLSYINIAPGEVILSWTFPENLRHYFTGSLLLYTDDKSAPQEKWSRIEINNINSRSIHLKQLRMGRVYQVRIIPRLHDGRFAPQFAETLEMTVDAVTTRNSGVPRDPLSLDGFGLPPRRRARYLSEQYI